MGVFTDSAEAEHFIGGMFERAVQEPSFVEATRGTGLIVAVTQTEPDAAILVDFEGQKVLTGDAAKGGPANVQLRMSSDNANKFWQGKLNFTLAMAQRKVKLDGKRSLALKLLPLTQPLFAAYIQLLKDEGREDLVVG
jgi:putative sterol carrier protein